MIVVVASALWGCACSHRAPLPASHAQPEGAALPRDVEPLADDPARVEVRRLHVVCDETVAALSEGVEDADRRENILTAAAALAYVVGTIADGAHGDHGSEGARFTALL